MRASSARLAVLSLAIVVVAGISTSAHRLDEYLQATRIDLHADGVTIDLALTPGAEIADSIVATIDRDHDGVFTADEQRAYAADVVRTLRVTLDGAPLPLRLGDTSSPPVDQLRRGEGTLRLQLRAGHPVLSNGSHQLFFSNGHLAGQSVYLANALVPANARVSVTGQRRTFDQRELTVDYSVGPAQAGFGPGGLMLGVIAAVVLVRYTRRHGNRP